ncbi:MAG TPA: YicC/YloC family endoribonuclease [Gemmatimonadaceae bacterium]|nr:YicC/YloC family endoribonuclease [Gemmatimonadaceae bacterium]
MIRSMTGFGTAAGTVGPHRVTVELRSVNHRFFSPSIKLPPTLTRWEPEVREVLRRGIRRGHVTLVARLERGSASGAVVNEERFAAYVVELRTLRQRYALGEGPDLATVLRLPDVLTGGEPAEDGEGGGEELSRITSEALQALGAMRAAEGERLSALLTERLAIVEQALGRVAARAPERLVTERDRLRKAIEDLTAGVALDPARVAQEIAVLADRLDVSEEIDRFRAHIAAFRDAIARAGHDGGVGKRLGFLLQEMLREANTTASKARDAQMAHDVVTIKEELERLAEQVENVE